MHRLQQKILESALVLVNEMDDAAQAKQMLYFIELVEDSSSTVAAREDALIELFEQCSAY